MRGFLSRVVGTAKVAGQTYVRTACGQRAAAISYHVLFSLVPFAALVVSVVELVLPETIQERVVSWLVDVAQLPGELGESVEAAVADAGPPASVAGAIALVGLVWAASGMMASVRSAFRAVWMSEAPRPYLRGKLLDVVLVMSAGLLAVSAFGLSIVVQVVTETGTELARKLGRADSATAPLGPLGELAASTTVAFVAFGLLYRVVPPVRVRLRDVLPAAIFAAVGVQVASAGFSVYLTRFADFDDVYGPLGAVLAFLLLVYVVAAVLLAGACVAAAWPLAELARHATAEPAGERASLRARVVRAARGLVIRDDRR